MLRSLGRELRPAAGRGARSARTSAWMRASSESRGRVDRVVVRDVLVCPQHELHLARVLAPGGEEAVVGEGGGGVLLAPDDRLARADLLPQRRGRVEEEEVHLAAGGERPQHGEVAGRDPRQAEERDALGEVDERRARLAAARTPARAARRGSARQGAAAGGSRARPARRPRREVDLTARPAAHHLRAVERVAVEQLGEVAEGGEPAGAAVGVVGVAQVDAQVAQPRLVEALADDLEQRPHRALRRPRVGVGVDPGRGRDGVTDEPVRERELDVRAHAVSSAGRRAEAGGEALREPALHASRRDGDDVGREGVGQRIGQEAAEGLDQSVGAFSSVDMQHGRVRSVRPTSL